MNLDSVLAGGGAAGLILALVAVAKVAKDWYRDHRELDDRDREQDTTEHTAAVTDAAAANAVVLASLKGVHEENLRLQTQVTTLQEQAAVKDQKISDLEHKLADAQRQIQAIANELAALKTQP